MRSIVLLVGLFAALTCPAVASAVVGGTAVKPGAYPFAAAIGDAKGSYYCGGTLIAPTVVLTAAHCLTERRTALTDLRVLVGTGNAAGVAGVFLHPKFDGVTMHYDAALLLLDRAATGVRTLPMATTSPLAGTTVTAAGWGKTLGGRQDHARPAAQRRPEGRDDERVQPRQHEPRHLLRAQHAVREQSGPRHLLRRQRRPARRDERRPHRAGRDHELRRRLRAHGPPRRLHPRGRHPGLGLAQLKLIEAARLGV